MNYQRQLGVLLRKNWIILNRTALLSFLEAVLPIVFGFIVLILQIFLTRTRVEKSTYYSVEEVLMNLPSIAPQKEIIGYIGYAPLTNETKRFMDKIGRLLDVPLKPFETERLAMEYFRFNHDSMHHIIVWDNVEEFSNSSDLPRHTRLVMRPVTGPSLWYLDQPYNLLGHTEPRKDSATPDYNELRILYIQRIIGQELIDYWIQKNGQDASKVKVGAYMQRMAYPPHPKDGETALLEIKLPMWIMLSLMVPVILYTSKLVYEKEKGLKESLNTTGLHPTAYLMSWFLTFFLCLTPSMAIFVILVVIEVPPYMSTLGYTSVPLFCLFMLCYAMAVITFCFMVSGFVQKARFAGVIGGALFFISYVPYFYIPVYYSSWPKSYKVLACFLPNLAMGIGCELIGVYEDFGEGANWYNFYEPAIEYDNLSLLECMVMLLVVTCLHLVATWYLHHLMPGVLGVPKPFLFFLTKSYWLMPGHESLRSESDDEVASLQSHVLLEKVKGEKPTSVRIKAMRKEYGETVVLDSIDIDIFQGEIFVFLGLGGAGKTTLLSMLSGYIPVTSGTAIINSLDIRYEMDAIRPNLGMCSQQDILYDSLTVAEHLQLFARLRRVPHKKLEEEILSIVMQFHLNNFLKVRCNQLSRSLKKTLSVAIAMIGKPELLLLDEPTNGMDTSAVVHLLSSLKNYKTTGTVIVATRHMRVADSFADRVAILDNGVLGCCGSLGFLRMAYGTGYKLVVSLESEFRLSPLTRKVQRLVPTATLQNAAKDTVTYNLPAAEAPLFADLFQAVEGDTNNLGIKDVKLTNITMEAILQKTRTADRKHRKLSRVPQPQQSAMKRYVLCEDMIKLTGYKLTLSRLKGLYVKKVIVMWRKKVTMLMQLLPPIILAIIGLLVDEDIDNQLDPKIPLDLSQFGRSFVPISQGISPLPQQKILVQVYAKQFGSKHDLEKVSVDKTATFDSYTLKRAKRLSLGVFNTKMVIGFEAKQIRTDETVAAIAHYNGQPYHAQAIAVDKMMNSFLQYYLGDNYSMQSYIHPLPSDEENFVLVIYQEILWNGMRLVVFLIFGMAFLTSPFIYNPIYERKVGLKHLERINGVTSLVYWLSMLIFDFVCYMVVALALVLVLFIFWKESLVADGRWSLLILMLSVYGWAMLAFLYAFNFLFKEPHIGVAVVFLMNIALGILPLIVVSYLQSLGSNVSTLIHLIITLFLILFPTFNLAHTLHSFNTNALIQGLCLPVASECGIVVSACCPSWCARHDFCLAYEENFLAVSDPGIGGYLLIMLLQVLLLSLIIVLVEYNYFHLSSDLSVENVNEEGNSASNVEEASDVELTEKPKARDKEGEDEDVAQERKRIASSLSDAIVLQEVCKKYGREMVVDHLSIGVLDSGCLGIVGKSGAGKSTIMKMIVGDVPMTDGQLLVNGTEHELNDPALQSLIGYCPQSDALIGQMTAPETLAMFARLNGIAEEDIELHVMTLIDSVTLTQEADELVENFSAANRRKLSTAIALVGNPPYLVLDEPSAGMDAVCQKEMWDLLSSVGLLGRTIVVTSTSLEECKSVCTTMAVLINGKFVCLGSPQQLENKFSKGYTVILEPIEAYASTKPDSDDTSLQEELAFTHVFEQLPRGNVFLTTEDFVHVQLLEENISLSKLFATLQKAKDMHQISDYTVVDTSLEQMYYEDFLTRQKVPQAKKTSWKSWCYAD